MLFDLHVHTDLSPCGHMEIDTILEHAKKGGLGGVCITDHDTMDIRHRIGEGVQDNGVCLIFGMEYSTAQGDMLIFGPYETLPADLPADTLLRKVRKTGGVAIAAHPFRKQRPADEQFIQNGLCHAVECINGRNTAEENSAVQDWLERFELAECGGSDAHTPEELGTVATRFFSPITSRTDLINALKSRMCRPELLRASTNPS